MRILGLIVARGNSQGVPGKHLRLLGDMPVITHVIRYATSEREIDKVALSSDSSGILDIARQDGIEAIERPAELAAHDVAVTGTLVHALQHMEKHHNATFDAVAILYGCVPFRPVGSLGKAVHILEKTTATAVRSYCPIWKFYPQFMVNIDDGKVVPYMKSDEFRRQDVPSLYYPDSAVILVRTSVILAARENGNFLADYLGEDVRAIVHDFPESIEIDEPFDLKLCELIAAGHL